MSTLTTAYKLYYPDSNTVTALSLFAGDGASITPQSVEDAANPPAGWKVKNITFASAVEAVFATPTFQTPASPVPVYLTYNNGSADTNVLNPALAFLPEDPGRPAPRGEHFLNYTGVSSGEGPEKTWTLRPPEQFTPKIRQRTKDPVTGVKLYGNDFSMLWYGVSPNAIQVQCDVEDITDPAGFVDVAYTNVTTYAESSVGMSLVKLTEEIIPQDGFSHALKFRVR